MAYRKVRKDTTCLNCGAKVQARYCSVCGQENVEPKESFGSLLGHFVADIIHFDGKFFHTSTALFNKPGFLSKEYMAGRRASYFHPVRMYVFTSALFFLVFFSLFIKVLLPVEVRFQENPAEVASGPVSSNPDLYSVEQYDSLQSALPEAQRDGWIDKQVKRKTMELSERYQEDGLVLLNEAWEKFVHNFPYLLFVSLPLYAWYLKLLYRRQKKEFYYADHAIFLIHLYVFTFLLLLLVMLLYMIAQYTGFGWASAIYFMLFIYGVIYVYLSMLRFYGRSKRATLLKFFLFNTLAFFSLIILFALFFVVVAIQL